MNVKCRKNEVICYFFFIILFLFLNKNLYADGFIVVPRPQISNPFPLEVKYHHVDVKIRGKVATTYIDQEFYNPTRRRLEGFYIFPIPKGAVLSRFSMFINGKEVEAELLDAKKARKIYEDIVRRQLDPALLEYNGMNIFIARIFPIEPRSRKKVRISYHEILKSDSGTTEYIYPLNTEKFSSKPLKDVSINIDIKPNDALKNIYCTSHNAEVVRKSDKHAVVTFEEQNTKPDTDFKIYFSTNKSKIGFSLQAYRESGEKGYFFLSASPGFNIKKNEIEEKDITFVLDTSGSMAGEKLNQAKKALLFCLNNLNSGDRFQIVRYSTEAEPLFKRLTKVSDKSLLRAKKFIKNFRAIGGTYIEGALRNALSVGKAGTRPYMIIFITDGKPTIGETDEKRLIKIIGRENRGRTRIFTFGIGYDINTHLLDKITKITKSYRTYITPKEDIEIKISNFYTKVQSPVLTDIKLTFSNIRVSKIFPVYLPDLFMGSSLTVLGRYSGSGKVKITLKGRVKNRNERFSHVFVFPDTDEKKSFVAPLWAARRIGYLLDQVRLNGEDRELVYEITELARKHGIVTPYTSYLILEDERKRVSKGDLEVHNQTLGNIASDSDEFIKRSRNEYFAMKKKSGSGSVRSSREFQSLNKALNSAQTKQGKSRMNFRDRSGNIINVQQQVKNIQGRAVYNSGKFWVDSKIQAKNWGRAIRIKFAGKKYIKLLRKSPEIAQFFALGKNARFVFKKRLYEVYE